jgi:hypothetical protein
VLRSCLVDKVSPEVQRSPVDRAGSPKDVVAPISVRSHSDTLSARCCLHAAGVGLPYFRARVACAQ